MLPLELSHPTPFHSQTDLLELSQFMPVPVMAERCQYSPLVAL